MLVMPSGISPTPSAATQVVPAVVVSVMLATVLLTVPAMVGPAVCSVPSGVVWSTPSRYSAWALFAPALPKLA